MIDTPWPPRFQGAARLIQKIMIVFLFRVARFAWQNFYRNIGLSLITILILLTTLISFDVILLVRGLTGTAIQLVEQRIDVSLLFKADSPDQKMEEIKNLLAKMPSVESLIFKNRQEVLEEFKKNHKKDSGILSALAELNDNPLGAVLIIRAKNTENYEQIIKAVDIPEYNALIEEKTFDDHGPVIKKISLITSRVEQLGLVLGLILTIVAFLIIFNVIRLSIIMHGEEIGIMKLVGASNWFVRLPFLLEMACLSLLAWLVNLGLLYLAIYFTDPYVAKFFEGANFSLRGYFNQNFLLFFGGELVGLIILSFLSSSLAMRRYLKV